MDRFDIRPRRGPRGKADRNADMRRRYHAGEPLSSLARAHNITLTRARQIVQCYKHTLDLRGMLGRHNRAGNTF